MSKKTPKIKVKLLKTQKRKTTKDNTSIEIERGKRRISKSFKSETHTYTFSTPEQAVNKFDKMKKAGTLKQKRLK